MAEYKTSLMDPNSSIKIKSNKFIFFFYFFLFLANLFRTRKEGSLWIGCLEVRRLIISTNFSVSLRDLENRLKEKLEYQGFECSLKEEGE